MGRKHKKTGMEQKDTQREGTQRTGRLPPALRPPGDGKKKLLVTASTFPRWKGDTEPRFVLDLSIRLTKYYDVTILVPAAPGAVREETMEGVRVIRYHYFPIHSWETLCYPGAIVPRIREKKSRALLVPFLIGALFCNLRHYLQDYDRVHAHWLIPQGIVQSFFRTPYLVTGHGGDVTSLNRGIVRRLKKNCLQEAGGISVVSNYLKSCLLQMEPSLSIEVLSMGCDTSGFGPQKRRTDYFGQDGKRTVLFVGRLVEIKGVTYLIEAMRGQDARLVIVGDGPMRGELLRQADGMGDKVLFLGPKTHEELRTIYASADIFAAPYVTARGGGAEGLGLTILEAMASGIVPVASRTGGIPDVISDGENGLLFEEKNTGQMAAAITRLLEDKVLYDRLRENARRTAMRFDYEVIAEKYYQLLEKTAENADCRIGEIYG